MLYKSWYSLLALSCYILEMSTSMCLVAALKHVNIMNALKTTQGLLWVSERATVQVYELF